MISEDKQIVYICEEWNILCLLEEASYIWNNMSK